MIGVRVWNSSQILYISSEISINFIALTSSIQLKHMQPNLFSKMKFLILENQMNRTTVSDLKDDIMNNGGKCQVIQCPRSSSSKIKGDYLLCQSTLDPKQIKQLLTSSVEYKDALDYNYIINCTLEGKVLPANSYRLRQTQKSQSGHPQKKTKVDNSETQPSAKKDIGIRKDITKQDGFSLNKSVIEELSKLYKVYANEGDKGRKIAYSRAIASMKALDRQLKTEQDIEQLVNHKHIGRKIVDKIKQLMKTGHINKLQKLQITDKNVASEALTRVWGIGAAKAKELYERGIKTIQDLRSELQKNPDILTKNQKIGLKYLQDLEIRIPRKKVERMFQVVKSALFQLVGSDTIHQIEVCGSYRRGKPTCGDMDVFITRKNGEYQPLLLTKLVQKLESKKFLSDHLTMPRHIKDKGCQSYMGICHLQDALHHRIDIKYYPREQFAFAVLYFTGSDVFNRKMRLQAMEQGYHLSDHGMHKVDKIGAKSSVSGPPIKCTTQKQIFDILNIEYKSPEDRDI